jgi:hypothetical protein
MLLATGRTKEGRRLLVLGLEQENIDRLLDDRPILKHLGEEGITELNGWAVTILGPEDTARFIAAAGGGG